jgi:GMP synthase (glutamine-hydrolysing)
MNAPLIERWLSTPAYAEELSQCGLAQDAAAIRSATSTHIAAMQSGAEAVFNGFLDLVGQPQRRLVLPSREWV